MPDDSQKTTKEKLAEEARAVREAAKRVLNQSTPILGSTSEDWGKTLADVGAMDRAFGEEEVLQKTNIIDLLRSKAKRSDIELRVFRFGPEGRFEDVTDDLKPGDYNPDDFVGFRDDEAGRLYPIGKNPRNKEEAMNLLREIIPGLRAAGKSESVRRMEATLADSAKTLDHWKD